MKNHKLLFLCCALAATLCLPACGVKSSYYQKQVAIAGAQWDYKFQPDFKFTVEDTAVHYRFYLLIRHDESYPNSNFWFRMKVKAPGDTVFHDGKRVEKDLADAKGEWLGRGMGAIWEHKIPLSFRETPELNRPGTYEIKIEHLMRDNPLPSVLNVGLMVEKTTIPVKAGEK